MNTYFSVATLVALTSAMDLRTKAETARIVSPTPMIQPAEISPVNDIANIDLIDIADIKEIHEHHHDHSEESDSSDSHGCCHHHCGGCYSHCCCSCSSDSSTTEETEPDCYYARECGEPTQCYIAPSL